ncbi:SLC2A4 regulator isoform X4 [Rousettus aegyptiacus]|nr:SLC2A4 regulator isoform X4 [Rousettus aegyptiacus]
MAAAALTSLSTSPLLLGAPAAAFSPVSAERPEPAEVLTLAWRVPAEPGLASWQEPLVQPPGSYSSSSSGDWGWDPASEQSSPCTPSPPLPPEAAHFLFGEPAPRKRKSSAQVLFQCLWKRCGKVLSTASGMQRHIRLVHLGRQAEPEQSDGEEDFYYTELDVGLDTLTDGLSSLTPDSPVASTPPAFPHLELPGLLHPLALPPPPVLSSAQPPQACHSDHSYQEAPRRRQEVSEGVRNGAPGPVVHGLPLEEGLPALPGLSAPAPRGPHARPGLPEDPPRAPAPRGPHARPRVPENPPPALGSPRPPEAPATCPGVPKAPTTSPGPGSLRPRTSRPSPSPSAGGAPCPQIPPKCL